MKKFKNLVIGGIETKVFNLILISILLVTVAGLLITNYQNGVLADLTAETGTRQREAIGQITDSVMEQVIDQNMEKIIVMEAQIADEMFRNLRNRVQLMGEYAASLFSDPGKVNPAFYTGPNAGQDGHLAAKMLLASGVGQTSRVDALKQAIEKAREHGHSLQGAVMASDAFFPFADCVQLAHEAGITAVIQPGGSVRDQETIDYCNEHGLAMVMTGTRHFRH